MNDNDSSKIEEDFRELFSQSAGDDKSLAALRLPFDKSHYLYIAGYEEAVNTLVDKLTQHGGDNGSIYPIIFLLRHTIELYLKDNIENAYNYLGSSGVKHFSKLWHTHDLRILSNEMENALTQMDINIRQETSWKSIKELLYKWEKADPRGMFFRYNRRTNGDPWDVSYTLSLQKIFPQAQEAINYLCGIREELASKQNNNKYI